MTIVWVNEFVPVYVQLGFEVINTLTRIGMILIYLCKVGVCVYVTHSLDAAVRAKFKKQNNKKPTIVHGYTNCIQCYSKKIRFKKK